MHQRSEYTFELGGDVTIGLTSTGRLELDKDRELLLGAYLPGVVVRDELMDETDARIEHIESTEPGLQQNGDEIVLHDAWNDEYPTDLPYLLAGVARALWIRRGIYPVHAACVGTDTMSLLPGNSGAGKSTVSLRLAHEHGQKIYSGNTTLVRFDGEDGMEAVGGTLTMTLRTDDFRQGEYDTVRSLQYGDRTAFLLADEQYADTAPQRIGKVALLRLTDRDESWERLSTASALHQLYPQYMDALREDTIVADGAGVYVGATPAEDRRQLAQNLRGALKTVPVWQGRGDAEYLTDKLRKQ